MDTPPIATKTRTRRRHSLAFKRKLVAMTERAGASVAAIALEHGVNANLLFRWKHQFPGRPSAAKPVSAAVLLPVTITPMPPADTKAPPTAPVPMKIATQAAPTGVIEIEVGGARVRLRGPVDQGNLRCVLQTLRQAP